MKRGVRGVGSGREPVERGRMAGARAKAIKVLSRVRLAPAALLLLLLACTRDQSRKNTVAVGSADSLDSARTATAAESVAAAQDQWNKAEVVKRLTEAGLVVIDPSTPVRHPFLSVEGALLQVSGSELQIFVYANAAAREKDSEKLDPVNVAPTTMNIAWRETPHLIVVGNLIAIHLTPKERLAERVRNALEARHGGA